MLTPRRLIDFFVLGRHRLEAIQMLSLGADIQEAIRLYGEPIIREEAKETSEITEYRFVIGSYHEAVVSEWKGAIQSITYWSEKSDPSRDIRRMLDQYREGSDWRVMEKGYWYRREDGRVRLWCSAAPAIGIAFVDFLSARANYKTAHELKELDVLTDATWAPNNAIHELQRLFVQEKDDRLLKFAARSDRIAVSPDGSNVFIVRQHHAYDVGDEFMEMNTPPKPESGYSTEVINCFSWSESGGSWSKVTLPTDAHVASLGFDCDQCRLEIAGKDRRSLTFRGPASAISNLATFTARNNSALWMHLEERASSAPPIAPDHDL